jgi:hypothetical protein
MIMDNATESVEINLTDSEFLYLARAAHDRNITFNELCNEVIRRHLDALDRNEEKR